jgi:hypothetical protein
VHAFYYLWYGDPKTDGRYRHWDHEILPHWDEKLRASYPTGAAARDTKGGSQGGRLGALRLARLLRGGAPWGRSARAGVLRAAWAEARLPCDGPCGCSRL